MLFLSGVWEGITRGYLIIGCRSLLGQGALLPLCTLRRNHGGYLVMHQMSQHQPYRRPPIRAGGRLPRGAARFSGAGARAANQSAPG